MPWIYPRRASLLLALGRLFFMGKGHGECRRRGARPARPVGLCCRSGGQRRRDGRRGPGPRHTHRRGIFSRRSCLPRAARGMGSRRRAVNERQALFARFPHAPLALAIRGARHSPPSDTRQITPKKCAKGPDESLTASLTALVAEWADENVECGMWRLSAIVAKFGLHWRRRSTSEARAVLYLCFSKVKSPSNSASKASKQQPHPTCRPLWPLLSSVSYIKKTNR